ncbi:hypothetical protein Tco_0850855 [Tanacetum coccineum]
MTPDLTCPSTHQLLWSSNNGSRPDVSLDKSGCLPLHLPFLKVDLVKTYRIPLDLHPRFPDLGFTMDRLPADAIGIYFEFLWAISDHLTWRHSCSCVSDDLSSDGYDLNDVQPLCARLIHLHVMREEVLVHSGLSSTWFNEEYYPIFRRVDDNSEMSIYNFMTLPSWSDAKIAEESHYLSLPLLERVPSHTTAPATIGAIIPLPTPDEIAASLPDSCLVKNSKGPSHANRPSKKRKLQKRDLEASSSAPELDQAEGTDETDLADLCAKIEDSLERDKVVSASEPSHVGTSAPAFTSNHSLALVGVVASGRAGKSEAKYDQIPDDDFGTATHGEEIDLTLFPLAPGPYHMPYPYEDVSSPLYTREEKALDQTITPAELRRTESLHPLELSNRVNVLSGLLVSHGYELNSCYANLVSSKAHLQEKFDKKKGDVKLLR